jgi:hypothetical protein
VVEPAQVPLLLQVSRVTIWCKLAATELIVGVGISAAKARSAAADAAASAIAGKARSAAADAAASAIAGKARSATCAEGCLHCHPRHFLARQMRLTINTQEANAFQPISVWVQKICHTLNPPCPAHRPSMLVPKSIEIKCATFGV